MGGLADAFVGVFSGSSKTKAEKGWASPPAEDESPAFTSE